MANRFGKSFFGKPENIKKINRFFLACEFKPNTDLWSVIEPFAYEIKPAFIYGKLGIINYNPKGFAIVEVGETEEPLLGYLITITHPDTILLLDKIKGYNGADAFNTHIRLLTHVYTDINKIVTAWAYVLSKIVTDAYQQIEQVEFGIWQENDKEQMALLDKITKPD